MIRSSGPRISCHHSGRWLFTLPNTLRVTAAQTFFCVQWVLVVKGHAASITLMIESCHKRIRAYFYPAPHPSKRHCALSVHYSKYAERINCQFSFNCEYPTMHHVCTVSIKIMVNRKGDATSDIFIEKQFSLTSPSA